MISNGYVWSCGSELYFFFEQDDSELYKAAYLL